MRGWPPFKNRADRMQMEKGAHGAYWPGGQGWHGPDSLDIHLARVAHRHAQAIFENWPSEKAFDTAMSAYHVGSAVELLAKAYLYRITPSLIADLRPDVDTLLYLAGKGKQTGKTALDVRTLSVTEALDRIKRLKPDFNYFKQQDAVVMTVRNAAAHLGLSDEQVLHDAILVAIRLLNGLVDFFEGAERRAFWGQRYEQVVEMEREKASRQAQRVASKLANAQIYFARLFTEIPEQRRTSMITAMAARRPLNTADQDIRWECPVCSNLGWLSCTEVTELADTPEQDEISSSIPGLAWFPAFFSCRVCGLSLESDELDEIKDFPPIIYYGHDDEWEMGEDELREWAERAAEAEEAAEAQAQARAEQRAEERLDGR